MTQSRPGAVRAPPRPPTPVICLLRNPLLWPGPGQGVCQASVSLDSIIIEHFVLGKLEQEVAAWAARLPRDLYPAIFILSLSLFSLEAPGCVSCLLTDVRSQHPRLTPTQFLPQVVPELIFLTFCDAHLQTKWNARTQTRHHRPSRYEV